MGISFRGLTSGALVANNDRTFQASNKDVADVPASMEANTTSVDLPRNTFDEKQATSREQLGAPRSIDPTDSDEELTKIDESAPAGVQAVQASTYVWTKKNLIIAYILVWLVQFILAFASSILGTLTVYVTSSMEAHSLTALTSVISSIVAGIWKLPYAKIMDVWGRPQALCIGVTCMTLGMIMMAGCKNIETVCAAQVFFYVGYNSIDFSVTVFIADTSKLKNRGLFIAYASSPWLITTWIYGFAVDNIVAEGGIGLQWGFGIFAIFVPLTCAPLVAMFFLVQAKAKKQGLIHPRPSRGSLGQTIYYYLVEFDVVGLLILAAGLALFLLSFNIYTYQTDEFASPLIICFLVFGALLVVAFGMWERFFAPITFVPWHLLSNRTVIFTYIMAGFMYIGWYVWDSYFYSLLIVLFNQPILYATYISNTYTMGSCFISIVMGVCLRYYGKLKMYSLIFGVPLTILGVGLMIEFRQQNVNIGYIVMCQIFIAFGGGILVIAEQTTLMAVSAQKDFPALLACESMIISIGSAIGSTIASALWTGIFPKRLAANLPSGFAQADIDAIYGSIDVQSSYEWGSPEREAINLSYAQTQRYMLISATCIYTVCLFAVCFWENVDVRKQKQRSFGLL